MSKKLILKAMQADLADNKAQYAEHLMLREILQQYEGKSITARVQSKLPEGYKYQLGRFNNGPEIVNPQGQSHYLCYVDDMAYFSVAKFDERNAPSNAGAKERVQKLEQILNNPEKLEKAVKHFSKLKKAYDMLAEICQEDKDNSTSYHNPAYYDICRALNINTSAISDFYYKHKLEIK